MINQALEWQDDPADYEYNEDEFGAFSDFPVSTTPQRDPLYS